MSHKEKAINLVAVVITIIFTLAGVVWAISAQNQKLESGCKEIETIKVKVDAHDKSITTIETKLDYITKGIDEIKKEVKK